MCLYALKSFFLCSPCLTNRHIFYFFEAVYLKKICKCINIRTLIITIYTHLMSIEFTTSMYNSIVTLHIFFKTNFFNSLTLFFLKFVHIFRNNNLCLKTYYIKPSLSSIFFFFFDTILYLTIHFSTSGFKYAVIPLQFLCHLIYFCTFFYLVNEYYSTFL